jgi:hypothetical protein
MSSDVGGEGAVPARVFIEGFQRLANALRDGKAHAQRTSTPSLKSWMCRSREASPMTVGSDVMGTCLAPLSNA